MKKLAVGLFVFLLCSSCGAPVTPDTGENDLTPISGYPNHPGQETRGDKNFAYLINNYPDSKLTHTPWASTYWPYKADFAQNGVASTAFSADHKSSPAGKYDAAHGCLTHAQDWETVHHGAKVKGALSWWGHCNGWSAAASLYGEPPAETVVNGVTFTRADVKALLTEAGMLASADYFGERVDPLKYTDYNSPEYNDVVPDQYFLALTNYMGKLQMPLVIDRYTGNEIWNQPLVAYKIEYPKPKDYLGADPQNPGVYRLNLTSNLYWADDSANPNDETPVFDASNPQFPFYASRTLHMEVWVDAPIVFDAGGKIQTSGDVVVFHQGKTYYGGAWHNPDLPKDHAHPDFMWVPYSLLDATDPSVNFSYDGDPDANPFVDYRWLVSHFIKHDPDDIGMIKCPIPEGPHPDPSPSPSPHPIP